MAVPPPTIVERIRCRQACAITGKAARVMQQMAMAGEIPGAVKIRGQWTFDETMLRAWIAALEDEQRRGRGAVLGAHIVRSSPRGATSRPHADSASRERYERAMAKLLGKVR